MKYCILYFLLSFSILSCININTIYVKKNYEIPKEIREEIKPLADSVYACFLNRNDKYIRQIAIPDIVNDISVLDSLFKYCRFTEREQSDLEEQFLIRNSTGSNINKVTSENRHFLSPPSLRFSRDLKAIKALKPHGLGFTIQLYFPPPS